MSILPQELSSDTHRNYTVRSIDSIAINVVSVHVEGCIARYKNCMSETDGNIESLKKLHSSQPVKLEKELTQLKARKKLLKSMISDLSVISMILQAGVIT